MKLLTPSDKPRLNEVVGVVSFFAALAMLVALATYSPWDPSWNTATSLKAVNKIGKPGAWFADISFTIFGFSALLMPVLLFVISYKWYRSQAVEAAWIRFVGWTTLVLCTATIFGIAPEWKFFSGRILAGGLLGLATSGYLEESLNTTGALMLLTLATIVSLYLISSFTLTKLESWFEGPIAWFQSLAARWNEWRETRRQLKAEKVALKKAEAAAKLAEAKLEKRAARKGKTSKEESTGIEVVEEPLRSMAAAASAASGAAARLADKIGRAHV